LNITAATLAPAVLDIVALLEFDHICITEATFDFGIVEVSTDFGNNWTELARFDMDDHSGWNDGMADPGDWVHESISLRDYLGEKVQVRFRLETDVFVVEDGWYIDNVQVSENVCEAIVSVPDELDPEQPSMLMLTGPNPFSSRLRFSLSGEAGSPARVRVFDAQGRMIASVYEGTLSGDRVELAWDGRDRAGRRAAAGFYLLRAEVGNRGEIRRVVKLP
jgi:hypothetical protein